MQILSFDTSTADVQIALMQDGQIVFAEKMAPLLKNRQESASMLLPGIDSALKRLGWRKSDLDLIVAGVGPGSFTGVRVTVIAARSIAQALGLGVLPVSSLEIMTLAAPRPCAAVLSAGAGKFYMGAYGNLPGQDPSGELLEAACLRGAELREMAGRYSHWVIAAGLEDLFPADAGTTCVAYSPDANLASDGALLAYKRISFVAANLKRLALAKAYPWDNVVPVYLASPSVTVKDRNGSSNKTIAGG